MDLMAVTVGNDSQSLPCDHRFDRIELGVYVKWGISVQTASLVHFAGNGATQLPAAPSG